MRPASSPTPRPAPGPSCPDSTRARCGTGLGAQRNLCSVQLRSSKMRSGSTPPQRLSARHHHVGDIVGPARYREHAAVRRLVLTQQRAVGGVGQHLRPVRDRFVTILVVDAVVAGRSGGTASGAGAGRAVAAATALDPGGWRRTGSQAASRQGRIAAADAGAATLQPPRHPWHGTGAREGAPRGTGLIRWAAADAVAGDCGPPQPLARIRGLAGSAADPLNGALRSPRRPRKVRGPATGRQRPRPRGPTGLVDRGRASKHRRLG